ncbi:uncharacterized protein AC631_01749 [Debaryomyces fabryi]|uniref:Topoisomerase I damage affected protein 2 n=1 Tax=Debaryomyces fabryi TaxID=58627 RepID=A0A0V1Q233_9ASCO|nr:uncharacterized protein AC631_01749 [Debaryomyces fabryi]KSA02476.1 hypothetical protein AC631_01749 [Debaryomyces fabryi]CUM50343.1 unnamed protein product [Debaryomyces fabryi]
MNSPIISITSSSASKESPITSEYLIEVINKDISKLGRTNELIEFLLEKLQKKSSKHKFLIQATRLKSPSPIETDLNILASFGAVWDSNRDGYISIKVELKGDKGKEADKNGDSTEIPTDKTVEKRTDDCLNNEEREAEKNDGNTLETGTNDKFNNVDTYEELLDGTHIEPDGDDSLKLDEFNEDKLKEQLENTNLEDHKVKTDISDNVGSEINKDLKEDLGTTEIEDDNNLEAHAVDTGNTQHKEQVGEDIKSESKDNDLLSSKEEVDSSTDTILVSVYWVFVD